MSKASDEAAQRIKEDIERRAFEERSRHAAEAGRKAAMKDYVASAFKKN
jgi:hypothetical protein